MAYSNKYFHDFIGSCPLFSLLSCVRCARIFAFKWPFVSRSGSLVHVIWEKYSNELVPPARMHNLFVLHNVRNRNRECQRIFFICIGYVTQQKTMNAWVELGLHCIWQSPPPVTVSKCVRDIFNFALWIISSQSIRAGCAVNINANFLECLLEWCSDSLIKSSSAVIIRL